MHSQKMPSDVKFSTASAHRPYEFIVHNAGHDTVAAGSTGYGPMLRDYSVLRCCTAGRGTLTINDMKFNVTQGQCYVILAGDVVSEQAASDCDFSISFVTFLGIKSIPYFNMLGITSQMPFFPPNICSICQDITDTLSREIGSSVTRENEFLRCSRAYWAMQKLYSPVREQIARKQKNKSVQQQYLENALVFMENHYTSKITVSDIAAHIGINRSYFYTLFKQYTGISPQEHLTRLRISKACELFSFPHATVVNVANALGFEPSVFFRHFKRITGVTPTEYKQNATETTNE